jgi:hypothetical protein
MRMDDSIGINRQWLVYAHRLVCRRR